MPSGFTLAEIAAHCGARLEGDGDRVIKGCAPLERATADELGFLHNARYRGQLSGTKAGAVILSDDAADDCPADKLIAENPYATYARAASLFATATESADGIHPSACVDDSAEMGSKVSVGANAVIEPNVRIGDGCRIAAGAVLGAGAILGKGCRIGPNVTVYGCVVMGRGVIVHGGAVIGADGFGLAMESGRWLKVPQLGGVQIGNDCEIGAGTTIDRGALDDTVLGNDVRLDNQIQIAHNVRIGEHTAMAGCSAVAGSTTIGRYCLIGGGAGILGHLSIADRVTITAMTLVTHSIRKPGEYSSGVPIDENRQWLRNAARFRKLDSLAKRVAALEKNSKK